MIANEPVRTADMLTREKILSDYRLACESRQVSLLGRRDVMGGRAKFGIFGDGKEVAQIAAARSFERGDFRSGYYRDQTFVAALGELRWQEFFAQLYAHTDVIYEPNTAGRSMNGHFATRWLDEQGLWRNNQIDSYNSVCDIAPTAGQIPRSVGLAYASKLYRQNTNLHQMTGFSRKGNEVTFATIGDASTAQGMFWETMNAAGVLQVPLLMSVWDDGYGISVPVEYQTTKASISKALAGLQRDADDKGFEIFTVKGWDYVALLETYQQAARICREEHVPVLMHVQELTQPQGHSSSGSHERYKSKERLAWEADHDCNKHFRQWILANGYATEDELEQIEREALKTAKDARAEAWNVYEKSMQADHDEAVELLQQAARNHPKSPVIMKIREELRRSIPLLRRDSTVAIKQVLRVMRGENNPARTALLDWLDRTQAENADRFNSHLYSESPDSPMLVESIAPEYTDDAPYVDGYLLMQHYFDNLFGRDPRVVAMGEDVGHIGDVNQGFAGLQEKYGDLRITDTGIRETTIIGQGIGLAMRGLRPITEIQYFDYIFYALATLTDDLATLLYRTKGGQKAPLIVRTRGHRLEGIWHSGSPMGAMINSLRGLHVLVPRNMTQAACFYNTLIRSDDPALVVECLNGYRLKERLPQNLDTMCLALGIPETLREGTDVTVVTYGSMCRIVLDGSTQLEGLGISVEVIDVQSLLPFDVHHQIVESIKKTNRVLFADEDFPGGATAYMMQQVVDEQQAYHYLDSAPRTLTAKAHRPPYGSDGDYYTKPNAEDVVDVIYEIMREAEPNRFPAIY